MESAWKRFWQKDLDAYIIPAKKTIEATDYVDRIVAQGLKESDNDDPQWYRNPTSTKLFGYRKPSTIIGIHERTPFPGYEPSFGDTKYILDKPQPEDSRFKLAFFNRMAYEIGGDFYKAASIGEDKYLVACLTWREKHFRSPGDHRFGFLFVSLRLFTYSGDPRLTTGLINAMVREVNPGDVFVTAVLFYIDFKTQTVEIHNCGFSPVFAFIPQEDRKVSCKLARPNLPPLGLEDKMVSDAPQIIPIVKGLRLSAYSDGLTDMTDPFGERYGDNRVTELLQNIHKVPTSEITTILSGEIDKWIGESHLADDITLVDIRFT